MSLLRLFAASLALLTSLVFAGNPKIELVTNQGPIILELYPEKAPASVANFLSYVKDGQYAGTIFHRVIPGFMVQGGGFTVEMEQKPTRAPIQNEANNGLKNEIGSLAMARRGDPHSATAQFFINVADNAFLDHREQSQQGWGYCVFGKVVKGMELVKQIAVAPTGFKSGMPDVPLSPIVVKEARLLK